MNLTETQRMLTELFQKELTNGRRRHLVFWYDEAGDFAEDIEQLDLPDVRIWTIRPDNLFATKYELEKQDPSSHFLLYAHMPKPSPREDWLYDQLCLGQEFSTDKVTVIMRELGLDDDVFRDTFKTYQPFFNNKERLRAFRQYAVTEWTEETVELTLLAALVKSRTNTMDDVVKNLLQEWAADESQLWEAVDKYAGADVFWKLAERYYGYHYADKSFDSFTLSLVLTHMAAAADHMELPKTWQPLRNTQVGNVVVFMDQWMNHKGHGRTYDKIADWLERSFNIRETVADWDVRDLLLFDSLRMFDDIIVAYIADQLEGGMTDYVAYADVIAKRRRSHWFDAFKQTYEALAQAIELLRRVHKEAALIPEMSAVELFTAYTDTYYLLDRAYRKFYVHYDRVENKGRLLALRDQVENVYTNHVMSELTRQWAAGLERRQEAVWALPSVAQQASFYTDWVVPYQHNNERVFVIVSDALRYEVAQELMSELNYERKASTSLHAMQTVLPSVTAFGMAALLPHHTLTLTDDGQALADGQRTKSMTDREKTLRTRTPESMAIAQRDVAEMNRSMIRETFQGKKLIYIYHNAIDAHGDNAPTEANVFQAAENAIGDIKQLVNQLVVNLSAANILITADHGFIYQREAVSESQKTPWISAEPKLAKRRFLLTNTSLKTEDTLTYPVNDREQEKPLFVTVPKGVSRFPVRGAGASFVHGGAMLQEIVVPVIHFKNDRSRSENNAVKQVAIRLTTPTRKITDSVTYLTFHQTERIDDKHRPLRLTAYFIDAEGTRITNENTIIADLDANHPGERTFREKFVFKQTFNDKRQTYTLILKNKAGQTDQIYDSYTFTIDITG